MSDLEQYDEQPGYDEDLPDDPRVAQLEQAVTGLIGQQFEDNVADFAADFPEFTGEEAAKQLIETAEARAVEMGAPWLAQDLRHVRGVAADLRVQAQAEASRPRTDSERFDAMLARHSKSVLPFG